MVHASNDMICREKNVLLIEVSTFFYDELMQIVSVAQWALPATMNSVELFH